jgi:lysine 2,3-aminomutase
MQEQQEEKIYGQMTPEQAEELYRILETKVGADIETQEDVAKQLRRFMRKHRLPFLATDRSVLNLPAIGKSMTFQLVGLTEEGKRILCFEHDGTRHHSPIINQMGQIYIVENKSLAASTPIRKNGGRPGRLYFNMELYERGNRTSLQSLRVS